MLPKKFLRALKSPRSILSAVTLVVLVLILFLSREELVKAWGLLEHANLWLLALLIPFQIIVYYAGGEMIFAYLRQKKLVHHISRFEQTRISLELNLVNHLFPSGGVSGISYTTWRLSKLGVNSASSTFAQVVRYVIGFLAFVALLIVSVLFLALDGQINRYIVAASFMLVLVIISLTFAAIYMFSSEKRMHAAAINITRCANGVLRAVTFGRLKRPLMIEKVETFFYGMSRDFAELARHKKLLVKPFLWGLVYAIFDVLMFTVTFWALGQSINPAILMVGYGMAGLAGVVAFTPGGAGVYEVIMIFFLTMAGVSAESAIAGIVLTRVILLSGTIVFGYIFYQHALLKYGKPHDTEI